MFRHSVFNRPNLYLSFSKFIASFYRKIMLFCLTDVKLGLATYFDQRKVSSTLTCPFQSVPSLLSLFQVNFLFRMGAVSHAHAM